MSRVILGLSCLLLAGCSIGKSGPTKAELKAQVEELQGQLDGLQAQVATAKEALDTVDSSMTDLETATSSFDDTDWKEVVPQVKTHVEELDTATTEALEAFGCSRYSKC